MPYQYLVGSGVVADVFPVYDGGFIAPPNDTGWPIQPRAIDAYGVPVIGSPVTFSAVSGGGAIASGDNQTFRYGVATGFVNLGPQLGLQIFHGTVGGISAEFDGYARPFPTISGGVVDGAAFQGNRGLAPGSYITIKGTELADATQVFSTDYLPVSLSAVSVSFDGGGLSLPGHLYFVSPGQINVQVPWEFQGQTSAMRTTCKAPSSPFRLPTTAPTSSSARGSWRPSTLIPGRSSARTHRSRAATWSNSTPTDSGR
jgi:hypothetical protein